MGFEYSSVRSTGPLLETARNLMLSGGSLRGQWPLGVEMRPVLHHSALGQRKIVPRKPGLT